MSEVLPYGRHWIDDSDIEAVVSVLKSDWLTQGPLVAEFEEKVARYCGAPYAVAFNSGTAALHAAVFASGVGPGDEVITSPLSFAASANCAAYLGAAPRFADIEKDGFNIDPALLRGALTPKTKAIVPVDFSGHPAELDEIMAAAKTRGITVIEDAAHSLGAEYKGRRVGSLADMTTLSFHPVKHITTGEGGMVLTASKDFRERLLRFRTHGIVKPPESAAAPWYYEMVDLGFNYRLTDLQCALGISQLSRLDKFLTRRRELASAYRKAFADHPLLSPLPEKPHAKSAHHLFCVRIDFERLGKGRAQVMRELRDRGVGTQVHYIPIHLHPFYRDRFGCKPGDFPRSEALYAQLLSLPLYPLLSDAEAGRVIKAVEEVVPRP